MSLKLRIKESVESLTEKTLNSLNINDPSTADVPMYPIFFGYFHIASSLLPKFGPTEHLVHHHQMDAIKNSTNLIKTINHVQLEHQKQR